MGDTEQTQKIYGKIFCRQTNVEIKFFKKIEQNLLQDGDFMKNKAKQMF
jgi:hypothetical protein